MAEGEMPSAICIIRVNGRFDMAIVMQYSVFAGIMVSISWLSWYHLW